MTTRTPNKPLLLTPFFLALLIGVMLAISSQPTRADSGDLPPRPTVKAVASSPVGGFIRLHVAFPDSWSWTAHPWQTILTQVQWQTGEGDWVDVTGWYGALDDVAINGDRSVTGTKTWWVAPRDYGAGPYRWLVTEISETSLTTSEPFTLPVRSAETVDIDIILPD